MRTLLLQDMYNKDVAITNVMAVLVRSVSCWYCCKFGGFSPKLSSKPYGGLGEDIITLVGLEILVGFPLIPRPCGHHRAGIVGDMVDLVLNPRPDGGLGEKFIVLVLLEIW